MKTCPLCDTAYPNQHTSCPTDGALLIESRELEPGTVIRGKYRVVRLLGRGGMGKVYLAEHILLGQQRALKFISGELGQDAHFLRRFRHEAQAAIKLRHPNIVEVVDLDQAEDGSPYIAMEYVEGPDLRRALATGAFSVERALTVVRGIAQGLGAAHAKGIVHRDVKPENILLAGGNGTPETPKLLDFGIAAIQEGATAVSRTRGIMLSPPYASPEQWRGTPSDQLDGRADLYALGGVLYEMLTGQTPFHAHSSEGWMHQHLHEEPQPPSALRPEVGDWRGLDALVLRLLAKESDQRPKDASELIRQLDAVRGAAPNSSRDTEFDQPAFSPALTDVEGGPKLARRRGVWLGSLTAGIILAALAAWFGLHPLQQNANQTSRPSAIEQAATAQNQVAQNQPSGTQSAQVNPQQTQASQPQPDQLETLKPQDLEPTGSAAIKHAPGLDPNQPMPAGQAPQGPKPAQIEPARPAAQPSAEDSEKRANTLVSQHRYPEAAPLYDQACNSGLAVDCFILGRMYHNGDGVSKDEPRAATLFAKACDGGATDACAAISYMYGKGVGVTKDESKAAGLLSRACDGGNLQSCYALGVAYDFGVGVQQDFPRAAVLYGKACNAGNKQSCGNLGQLYLTGKGVARDYFRAADLLANGCDAGSDLNCFNLGLLYETGNGVTKDTSRAAAMFSKACDGGNASGCGNLGHVYANGDGVTKDLFRAATSYSKACDAGIAMSCAQLANLYQQGSGVAKDLGQALTLYSKACNAGYMNGCTGLGFIYLNGDGIAKDAVRAAAFLTKSCDAGEPIACSSLGSLYQSGEKGIPKDKDKAKQLYGKACSLGNQQSCDLLKKLH